MYAEPSEPPEWSLLVPTDGCVTLGYFCEMMFFVLQRRWVAIRLPRLIVMTSVIFCKLVKDFGRYGDSNPRPLDYRSNALPLSYIDQVHELSAKFYADHS